ncbi:MAG TPA: hypothetical protein VGQ73_07175 [Gemmatimonadales bacterium]|nr:hypothetical protein [Gemmatimonadales bacterium]
MPPAPLSRMSATASIGPTELSAWQGDALVPVTLLEGGSPDPVALATWHLALSASSATYVPNDLFALWLFPVAGGIVLLGPEALVQDDVKVPLPRPHLLQDDLYQLEEILRRAKYPSAIAVPIRQEARDVGVMLLGSFARGAFGPGQAVALYRLAGRLAPAMARLAETMHSMASRPTVEPLMTREELPEHLARAACESASGPDLVGRVSGILYALLPHDRLEILVPGVVEGSLITLSGKSARRHWSTGGGGLEPYAGIVTRFGGPTLLLEDLAEQAPDGEWLVGGGSPSLQAHSVLGVRLEVGGRLAGYLLLGSVASDTYRPDDEDLLALAGLILAPRVAALRATEPAAARNESEVARELPLSRAADILAGTAHLGEGLAGFAVELAQLLPHQGISLHLRWGEAELIAIDPSALRPFADLPASPIEEFAGAAILSGEREWLVRELDGAVEVLVPLRVAGRTMGTLGVRNDAFDSSRSAAAIARQFADVLAPHLELLRRGAALAGPGARERTPMR